MGLEASHFIGDMSTGICRASLWLQKNGNYDSDSGLISQIGLGHFRHAPVVKGQFDQPHECLQGLFLARA